MIGKGFGKRFEAPSYEEGVGVDGSPEACLGKRGFFQSLRFVKAAEPSGLVGKIQIFKILIL